MAIGPTSGGWNGLTASHLRACHAEENPHPLHRWTLFRCLTADLDLDAERYLLNAGKWYRVNQEFVAEADQELASLLDPTFTSTMPDWGFETALCSEAGIAFGIRSRDSWAIPPSNRRKIAIAVQQ
jgi:uncharacterized protein (TIGR04141 family)